MRQLAFACAFLAIASSPMLANATSENIPCTKPVVKASFPADGMIDVPINAIGRVWLGDEEIECVEPAKTYRLQFANGFSHTLGGAPYTTVSADEESALPPNSEVELSLLEDDKPIWSVKFTTGSDPAAPPVAPAESKLVSLTFGPVADDDSHYHAFAHVRFRPGVVDPLASGVLAPVDAPGSNHAPAPGEDGWFDMKVGGLATASTPFCVQAGIENAAGEVAFGEPLCADAPAPASGCSVGGGSNGLGGAALLALLSILARRRR